MIVNSASALYTFLPLVVTVTINSLISVSLLSRERQEDRAGCAGCRLEGGACGHHQGWLELSREKDRLEKLLKMKTVRMTVITAFGFLLCQVIISVRQPQISVSSQVPSSILWLIAWENRSVRGEEEEEDLELSPVLIEVSMAGRFLYIIIVPLLHGAVADSRHRPDNVGRVTFTNNTVSHININ